MKPFFYCSYFLLSVPTLAPTLDLCLFLSQFSHLPCLKLLHQLFNLYILFCYNSNNKINQVALAFMSLYHNSKTSRGMKNIGRVWGEWLKSFGFNYVATIRPSYSLKEHNASKMIHRLAKRRSVEVSFIALEPDRDDNHKHGHLLFKAIGKWDRERLANTLNVHEKDVPFCQEITDVGEIEVYCSKHVYKQFSFHDIQY